MAITPAQIVNETSVAIKGKRGFFSRIGEKLGFVQKEVQECAGKTINEVAEMTSRNEALQFYRDRVVKITTERNTIAEKVRKSIAELSSMEEELSKLRGKLKRIESLDYRDNFCGRFGDMSTAAIQRRFDDMQPIKDAISDLEKRISIASAEKARLMSNFNAVTSNLNSVEATLSKMEKL